MVYDRLVTSRDCDTKDMVYDRLVTYRDCDTKDMVYDRLVTSRTLWHIVYVTQRTDLIQKNF